MDTFEKAAQKLADAESRRSPAVLQRPTSGEMNTPVEGLADSARGVSVPDYSPLLREHNPDAVKWSQWAREVSDAHANGRTAEVDALMEIPRKMGYPARPGNARYQPGPVK